MIRRPPRSTLSLHDGLPIYGPSHGENIRGLDLVIEVPSSLAVAVEDGSGEAEIRGVAEDRKSTRLNSSHANISYAAFCLKKKYFILCHAHNTSRYTAPTPSP